MLPELNSSNSFEDFSLSRNYCDGAAALGDNSGGLGLSSGHFIRNDTICEESFEESDAVGVVGNSH